MALIPVFPLNTVLFPGVVAPLHIFEDRYRELMRDLLRLEHPAERLFAVVAIREGYEVGARGAQSLHRIGTAVQLTSAERYDDGRYDIEVTGRHRVRLDRVDGSASYLRAECADLDQGRAEVEPAAAEEGARTLAAFEEYRDLLSRLRGGPVLAGELPRDPEYLSYSLAATCLLSQAQRQELLEAGSAALRLRMLRRSLREEMRAMRALPSLPATEVARTRWSPN